MNEEPRIISNTLHTAAIAALEAAINQALKLDPATRLKLQSLQDHVFLIHCTKPALSLYFIPGKEDVRLCGIYPNQADTTLTGTAAAFATLASASDPASTLINGELTLHGDSQALISLQKIISQLDLDWEAPLADLFGDVAGHQLGRGIRQGLGFAKQLLTSAKRQLDDYLVQESDLVAPRWQAEQFMSEVDQLAMRTERLEAKLARFKQRLQARG